MVQREIIPKILEALKFFPIVGIIGCRQVGKTTLTRLLEPEIGKPVLFLDLERDSDRLKLAEPELFLSQYTDRCVVIDEVQNMPSLLPLLRWLTDQHRVPARFILTGSASPDLIKGNTESLAGRIAYFELSPFSLSEIAGVKTQQEHWFRGGFPDALLAPNAAMSELWLNNFIDTYLQRDIRRIGFDITVPAMERLLKLMAFSSGNLLNVEDISRSLGIGAVTVKKYIDILEGSFLLRRLEPFYTNLGKRLVKSPKLYFRDTGLMHRLIGLNSFEQLHGSNWLGASWESYVLEEIIRQGGKQLEYTFFRTQVGAEVDLVIRTPSGSLIFVEIKYSVNASPSKGFYSAVADLSPNYQYIIIPEGESWFNQQGVKICGLKWFLEKEITSWL